MDVKLQDNTEKSCSWSRNKVPRVSKTFLEDKLRFFMMDLDSPYLFIFWFLKIGLRKWIFLGVKEFFSWLFISKMGVKMNFRIITKYRWADPERRFLTKSILKPYGYATAMAPAWEISQAALKKVSGNDTYRIPLRKFWSILKIKLIGSFFGF